MTTHTQFIEQDIALLDSVIEMKKSLNWPVDHAPVNPWGYKNLHLVQIQPDSGQVFLTYSNFQTTLQLQKLHIKDLFELIVCLQKMLKREEVVTPSESAQESQK